VADALPLALVGKGKRVAGVFVFMIGASIILDTHTLWVGALLLGAGAVLFAWGMVEARRSEPAPSPAGDATTESGS
jgi:hypothetical protein